MEALAYTFNSIEWNAPGRGIVAQALRDESDAMHALLVLRADKIEGYAENSEEENEFTMICEVIETYEAKRWPEGKVPGGKD
jgi:hypothetical protein